MQNEEAKTFAIIFCLNSTNNGAFSYNGRYRKVCNSLHHKSTDVWIELRLWRRVILVYMWGVYLGFSMELPWLVGHGGCDAAEAMTSTCDSRGFSFSDCLLSLCIGARTSLWHPFKTPRNVVRLGTSEMRTGQRRGELIPNFTLWFLMVFNLKKFCVRRIEFRVMFNKLKSKYISKWVNLIHKIH